MRKKRDDDTALLLLALLLLVSASTPDIKGDPLRPVPTPDGESIWGALFDVLPEAGEAILLL